MPVWYTFWEYLQTAYSTWLHVVVSFICRTAHVGGWTENRMGQVNFTRGCTQQETKTPFNVYDVKGLLTMLVSTEVAAKFTLITVRVTRSEHRSYAYVNSMDSHPPNQQKVMRYCCTRSSHKSIQAKKRYSSVHS